MGPDLLAVTPAHSELRGQLPQTPRSRLIGFQHLHTQIIRIRLCHHLVFAKIAKPTMTALPFPAYNYCDSALIASTSNSTDGATIRSSTACGLAADFRNSIACCRA